MSKALAFTRDRDIAHLRVISNMSITSVLPSLGSLLSQTAPYKIEEKPKRPRGKNVSWPADDKLCQVRLFAAEDAPSLSGTVLQDLLQAKQTRFMHTATPVPTDDLPPGFEGVAAKRARLDAAAIAAMVPQIPWQFPGKFLLDPSWQAVCGEESTEVTVQQQRELRVLEAVYPRPSAIPFSPAEPQEIPQDVDDSLILQIPLVPLEDDDIEVEEKYLQEVGTSGLLNSIANCSGQINNVSTRSLNSCDKDQISGPSGGMSGFSPAIVDQTKGGLKVPDLRDADPNIAAAAAAAYAAVKSKEAGRMIDHELLRKILTNPILIETLTALNHKPRNPAVEFPTNPSTNRAISNGNHVRINNEQPKGASSGAPNSLVSQTTSATLPEMHGGQKSDAALERRSLQGVQVPPKLMGWNGSELDRSLSASGSHEHANGMGGAHGSVTRVFGMNSQGPPLGSQMLPQVATPTPTPTRTIPPHQDYLKELIQQHGTVRSNVEAHQKQGHSTPLPLDDRYIERQRSMGLRLRAEPSGRRVGNEKSPSTSLPAKVEGDETVIRDRHGGISNELGRTKSRKPCLYFNTPRGCRNGVNCSFLHEPASEKLNSDRPRTDLSQLQQVKRLKVETETADPGKLMHQSENLDLTV